MAASPPRPAVSRARAAALALLLASLAAGVLLPVYTDEVAWRFQLSRFLLDGGVDRAVGESCGPNTVAVPPPFMWPIRAFSSAATALTGNPLEIRLAGVALAMLGVAGLGRLVRRLAPPGRQRDTMELVAYAMAGMGVLPFLLVWSRPEQPLWLALLAALLVAMPAERPGAPRTLTRLAAVLLLGLAALAYHPKAVFYLPAFVALLFAVPPFGRRPWPRIAAGAALGAAGAAAYGYWSHRLACPADPALAAMLGKENAAMLFVDGGWRSFAAAVPRLVAGALPTTYVLNAGPQPSFMSAWLPPPPVSPALFDLWRAGCTWSWAAALLLAIAALARSISDRARLLPRLLAGGALLGCASALAAFQISKATYECALYLPVVLAGGLLCWSASARHDRLWERAALGLAAVSCLSQAVLVGAYAPLLWREGRAGGYVAAQPHSVSAFAYPARAIAAAGAACGLAPDARPRRVVVDDLTYFAYRRGDMPLYHMGVVGMWRGSIANPDRWMRTHGSAGAVLACAELPPGMRARATATGPLCCLSTRAGPA